MTDDLTITKYDSELTSLHYLKLLQWFKESDFGKIKGVPWIMCSLAENECELDLS